MKLHKIKGNWYAIETPHDFDEYNFWNLAYKFSFGTYQLDLKHKESFKDLCKSLSKHGEDALLKKFKPITNAMESIYTFLYESGTVEENFDLLSAEALTIDHDIFSFGGQDCNPNTDNSGRQFYHFHEFYFDLIHEREMMRFSISPNSRETDYDPKILEILGDFCTNKLFETYKSDRTRTHLAKYQDKYFAADLGL